MPRLKLLRYSFLLLCCLVQGVFAQQLIITSSSALPRASVQQSYSTMLSAVGGTTPFSWGLIGGSLPPGLSINGSTGTISGTPTAPGIYSFTVLVLDSRGNSTAAVMAIAVQGILTLSGTFPGGTIGAPYSQTVTAAGGTGPYTYSLVSGALPAGLTLNPSTGVIAGSPLSAATFPFVIGATDTIGATVSRAFSITVAAPPVASPRRLADGAVGETYTAILQNSAVPASFTVQSGSIPPGLGIAPLFDPSRGCSQTCYVLTGVPVSAGTYSFTTSTLANFTITIDAPLRLTGTLSQATAGQSYSASLASGGFGSYSAFVSAGSLPAGITLDSTAARLTGVPRESGPFAFTITLSDAGNSVSQDYSLSVLPSIQASGVTNGASFQLLPIAPGEIITLFGSGLGPANLSSYTLDNQGNIATQLSGTRVLFDGIPAPILYASGSQLSAIVPYEMEGRSRPQVQVEYRGVRSSPLSVATAQSALGLFTYNGSGRGQAAALNQDSSVNSPSNPANRGSVIVLFATGEGQTDPAGANGIFYGGAPPKPRLPISVFIDGISSEVLYAGEAPGAVAGLLQVNARIPDSVRGGVPVPVEVHAGNASSQPGVTISIGTAAQAGCDFKLERNQMGFPFSGGSARVGLTTAANCTWTAESSTPWITITSGSFGTGNGIVSYSVAANPGSTYRTGTFNIAGQKFYVTQGFSGNQPPTSDSVNPRTGLGPAQTFQFKFSDPNGNADLQIVEVFFNTIFTGAHACFVRYYAFQNMILLADDPALDYVGGIAPATPGTLRNSQCTLNAANSTVVRSGNTITLDLDLSFASTFIGDLKTYGMATDSEGLSSGWQPLGTWRVAP